jgi:arylsulfatase A-like enzyme
MPEHHWNPTYDRHMRQYLLNTRDFDTEDDYFVARTLDAGLRWMESNAADGPFMLWLDTFDPHEPWDAPPRFQRMYRDDYGFERYMFGYGVRRQDVRDEDLPVIRDLYAAEVSFVDDRVGRLLEGMESLGLLDDTAVLFTTDHGTHLGEEGCLQKTPGLCNSAVSQLPLLLRLPGSASAGTRVRPLVSAVDLMPGLLELLGIDHELRLDGESFVPLIDDPGASIRPHLVTEFERFACVRDLEWAYLQETTQHGLFTPEYVAQFGDKMAEGGPGVPHLWDLRADPGEAVNVAADHPEKVEWAQAILRATYAGV